VCNEYASLTRAVSQKTVSRVLKGLQKSWHRLRRVVGGQPDPQEYREKQAPLDVLQQQEEAGEIEFNVTDIRKGKRV
jgi:hypothetical protein